jgi:hypothetical protein
MVGVGKLFSNNVSTFCLIAVFDFLKPVWNAVPIEGDPTGQ